MEERKLMKLENPSSGSRGFSPEAIRDTANVPLDVRIFGIGCQLAELIVALRAGSKREDAPLEIRQQIDRLNRDFGNLREVLQTPDVSLAAALIDPVLDAMVDTLAYTSAERPKLSEQCELLSEDLRKLLEPPTQDDG